MNALTEKLDEGVAKVQGEVARFLLLKERIMGLPSSGDRAALLARQTAIENKAVDLLARAQAVKADVTAPFNPFDASSYSRLGPAAGKAVTVAKELGDLLVQAQSHRSEVERATGGLPTAPAASVSSVSLIYLGAVAVAAWAFMRKR